jgi:type VI secretion system protein ImpA
MNELIEELLQPVPGDKPCGPDLSNDPRFDELQSLLKGKPEVEVGSIHKPPESPDWGALEQKSSEFLRQSKHLGIAMMLCCSLLKTSGLPGFRDGLRLIRGLLERYWTTLYPLLDPDDNSDPTYRLNILTALSPPPGSRGSLGGWLRFTDYLYTAPLCQSKGAPSITFEMLQAAKLKPAGAGGGPADAPTLARLAEALRSGAEQVAVNHKALQDSIEAVHGLDQFLTTTLSASQAMSFDGLEKTLKELLGILQPSLPAAAGQAHSAPEAPGTAVEVPGPASSSIEVSGSIRSREDVVRVLDSICRYYDQVEPASPVPYLLRRAQKLATMNFVQAMKELNLATVDALRPSMGSTVDEKLAGGQR